MFVYEYHDKKQKNNYRKIIIIASCAIIAFILVSIAINIYLEVIQLDEIGGFSDIYLKNLLWKGIFSLFTFLIIFISFFFTNMFILKNAKKYYTQNNLQSKRHPNLIITLIIAVSGVFMTQNVFYLKALSYLNSTAFGKTDPLFGSDIGYYLFQRPFLMSLYDFIYTVSLLIIIYTAVYYLYILSTASSDIFKDIWKAKGIIRHLLINIALFFGIKAFSYKFKSEDLLYSDFVGVTGTGFIGVNIWMTFYKIAPYILLGIVLVSLFFLWKSRFKAAGITIAVFPAVWIITMIIAALFQSLVVKPNEYNLESAFLKYNMQYTKDAYNLNKIKEYSFESMETLTQDIVNRNPETINNIRVVDYASTLVSNIQLQSNTNFYSFNDGDIINYNINGKQTPVFLTAREIDKNRLPDKTYLNITYKYTHGYGIVMNPINKITSEGQVDFILSGLVMKSADKNLKISQPRIYYGELTKDHVIVNAANNLNEIDYDGNTETRYDGQGGINLGLLNRLLFALKYGDMNLAISGYPSGATLLLNRQIVDRAQKAFPFLAIDNDPYIILTDEGRLEWVLDAYTVTPYYPYSQYSSDFNYIRNSAKVIIDAYDGKAKCYIIDNEDPIINTFDKIYPGMMIRNGLPASVSMHMRYPESLFELQTEVMKRYHLDPDSVSEFYTKQDLWDIAKYPSESKTSDLGDIDSYYNMIRLPSGLGSSEELILMRPFTPSNKNNLVSWLVVRNSDKDYGELILFNYPKNTNIIGPYQVEVKINQIDKVSKDISLWGQSGSSVYKGSLLVIPLENSMLYVEPIYIRASGDSSIPEVREIIVGYQSGDEFKYGIGTSLKSALDDLFAEGGAGTQTQGGQTPGETQGEGEITPADKKLLEDLIDKYNELKRQFDDLGELIDQLK